MDKPAPVTRDALNELRQFMNEEEAREDGSVVNAKADDVGFGFVQFTGLRRPDADEGELEDEEPEEEEPEPEEEEVGCEISLVKMLVPVCMVHGVGCPDVYTFVPGKKQKYPVLNPHLYDARHHSTARLVEENVATSTPVVTSYSAPNLDDENKVVLYNSGLRRGIATVLGADGSDDRMHRLWVAQLAEESELGSELMVRNPADLEHMNKEGRLYEPPTKEQLDELMRLCENDKAASSNVAKILKTPERNTPENRRQVLSEAYRGTVEGTLKELREMAEITIDRPPQPDFPPLGEPRQVNEAEISKETLNKNMASYTAAIDNSRAKVYPAGQAVAWIPDLQTTIARDRESWDKMRDGSLPLKPVAAIVPLKSAGLMSPNPDRTKMNPVGIVVEPAEQRLQRHMLEMHKNRGNAEFTAAVDKLVSSSKGRLDPAKVIALYFLNDVPTTVQVILRSCLIQEFI